MSAVDSHDQGKHSSMVMTALHDVGVPALGEKFPSQTSGLTVPLLRVKVQGMSHPIPRTISRRWVISEQMIDRCPDWFLGTALIRYLVVHRTAHVPVESRCPLEPTTWSLQTQPRLMALQMG